MGGWKNWVAALLAGACLQAAAGETDYREAIRAEVRAAFARRDFAALEKRYADALASSERTPSGVFVAGLISRAAVSGPGGDPAFNALDTRWQAMEAATAEWAKQFPHSTLAVLSQSEAYLQHGWAYRGEGYAYTVSPEASRKLKEYAGRAHEVLLARETAGRKDPNWYVQMLEVARVQGWSRDRTLALFRDASKAFPINYDIYFAAALQLTPRWGGSQEAVAGIAAYAVEQSRKVEGETLYARIYWAVWHSMDAEWSGPDVDWKRVRAGFEDVIKRYPDRWNLNHYARFACDAGDVETSRRLLLRIRGDLEHVAWQGRAHYQRCVQAAGLKREDVR